ncbi:MAG: 2,3-bisphosphoglycerate-independent phosphoglycerate mutase, partial [Veillonella sp.]|nr:2,3-bisphosphoglycerate-independent phosphoglycerate mutase [Veillonella sp.]
MKKPVVLTIMDGFGYTPNEIGNAISLAGTPRLDEIAKKYKHTLIQASGLDVGLPNGQMGNSEVGHLNLGSGRIVYQDLTRITKDVESGEFFQKPVIQELYKHAKHGKLQIIGLVSDGNVHCSLEHIKAVIAGAKHEGIKEVYVHAILDGRDVPPQSALTYLKDLESFMSDINCGKIATVSGRYYGMDRDNRWDREELAYNAIVNGVGNKANSACDAVTQSYTDGVNDEFVVPTVINPNGMISDGDAVIFCNFRPDRARELTKALTVPDFEGFKREPISIFMATMTKYEDGLPVHIVYEKDTLHHTLGEVLADGGYRQLRIAETEKYAHVTYFFNGGNEVPFEGEDRI